MRRYVADTHSILWYLAGSRRLPRRARSVFRAAKQDRAQILVPSIVLVEAVFLVQRRRISQTQIAQLFELSENEDASIFIVPLDMAVAQAVSDFGPAAIPDMPDRIIAATARALEVPLVTVDPAIAGSGLVEVIW